jgi:hypothetical protein
MNSAFNKTQVKESSILGDSKKGSKQGYDKGKLLCSKALQGASDSGSVSLESLTEKVGTLGLQRHKSNWYSAAKRQACTARHAEAPMGESACGQT